jgi:anaerobic magnesium-protoporphyrin IX monomethyl ester cyclase
MKILFLYPQWTGDYVGISKYFAKRAGGCYPPLNLALLAAIAEQSGHDSEIIDAEALNLSDQDLVEKAIKQKPEVIALTGMSPFFHRSTKVASMLKDSGTTAAICIGGQHITIMEEKAMESAFDFGFVGDGEEPWRIFLDTFKNSSDFSLVPGLIYRQGNQTKKNPRRSSSKDLDIYPWPARHLLPMDIYRLGTMRGRLPFTTIQTVRGCPWKCIFCASDQLATTRISKRSIASIVDEIDHVVNSYGTRHFMIVDDVLTLSRKRTVEFCNSVIEKKLDITFESSTRANLVDDDLVGLMKKAGLIRLSFGLETVDEEMRKTMNKKVPLEAYKEANHLCNKHDIEVTNSVMIGLPGETRENVYKTLRFLRQSKDIKQVNFAIATPYPGTAFYDMAVGGTVGVDLLIDDFSQYKRYGQAVTQIGELSPDDLVQLQNEGFVSIYSAYWRWLSVLKKHGVVGLLLTLVRLFKLKFGQVKMRRKIHGTHPALE